MVPPRPGPAPAPAPAQQAGGRRGGAEPGDSAARPGRALGYLAHSSLPGFQNQRPRGGGRGVDTGAPGAGRGADAPPSSRGGRWPAWSRFCNRVFFFYFFFLRTRDRSRWVFGGRRLSPCESAAAPPGDPLWVPNFLFSFFAPPIHFYRFSDISRAVPQGAPPRPSVKFEFPAGGGVPAPAPSSPGWGGAVWGRGGSFSLCTRAGRRALAVRPHRGPPLRV